MTRPCPALFALLFAVSTSAACGMDHDGPSGPPPPDGGARDGAPIADGSVLAPATCALDVAHARCGTCHAATPRLGAPMPLVTAADFQALAPSGVPYAERALDRIGRADATRMPPTSQPDLGADERALLTDWLARGAPDEGETCGIADAGVPPACVGPDCLPCTPTHTFVASDGASGPFTLPEGENNTYECFAFRSPFTRAEQGIAWAPIVDDARVLHHIILYRTATPQTEGPRSCQMPIDATGIAGWAPGGENVILPDDVGLELAIEEDEWLILQVHYWNAAGYTDVRDRSGMALCTTETPRDNLAGTLTFGSTLVSIPPRAAGLAVSGSCPSTITAYLPTDLHILASGPHMHGLGRRFETVIYRATDPLRPEPVVTVDPWSFDDQRLYFHDTPIAIHPFDTVRTTCTYDNPSDGWVNFGERTEDEMCFDFSIVYPIDAIPATVPRACINW